MEKPESRIEFLRFDGKRVILEPGDMGRYDFVIGQTPFQKVNKEIVIFSLNYAIRPTIIKTEAVLYLWDQIRNLPLHEQVLQNCVNDFNYTIMTDCVYNAYIARATIEAAARYWREK